MAKAHILTRTVTIEECPWFSNTGFTALHKGTVVFACKVPTYGAVRQFAATLDPQGGYPFFELPYDSVEATDE
jgi:hypothetical protein